ncbi:uncharacterized protein [Oryza sativa Japonica Group]|uniref:uncharacterized protein n=1 Tax=Oryza sativa subsp. japonica TaxID=39947 RepID=UPI00339C1927
MRRELLAAVPTHEAARKARWSEVKLTFHQSDHPIVLARGGKLALVVSPTIHNVRMKRVLVNGGPSLSIISPAAFNAFKAPGMKLQPLLPIIGVTSGHTWPLGHVELPVTVGDSTNFRIKRIDYDVADLNLSYNAVLSRPVLVKFMAATHYAYLQMKMSGPSGPITVFGDVKVVLACAEQRADNLAVATEPQAPEASASHASKKLLTSADEESALVSFLRANSDVFAWKPSDMPRVPREVIEHRLAVRPDARPVRQKVRRQAPERQAFIREEVARLLEAGFIHEVIHPEWLANPVVVPKTNGKLRMCIDYTDLNKWAIELAEFDLRFEPRHAIKSQVLADFVVEWTPVDNPVPSNVPSLPGDGEDPNADIRVGHWVMHFDGSLNLQGAGLLAGLRVAAGMGIRRLLVLGDSQLVVNQVSKEYQCTDPQMDAYVCEVWLMERHFDGLELRHVPRRDNTVADELSRVASARAPLPLGTFEERLAQPSAQLNPPRDPDTMPSALTLDDPLASGPEGVDPDPPCQVVWMTDIQAYLDKNTLPEDRAEAEKLACISKRHILVEGTLYRRAANGILLKCISREQGIELIADAHQGECGAHSVSRTLVDKAFRQGFYWPTALQDAQEWVRRCKACQFHAKQGYQPAQALHVIPLSWSFAVWGLDILGPFKAARGGYQHLYVAIDKFTKWPEAYPVVKIDKHSALKFIRGITSRFGAPNRIITDNSTQFTSELFGNYCDDMGIKLCFALPAHPKSNGQVE